MKTANSDQNFAAEKYYKVGNFANISKWAIFCRKKKTKNQAKNENILEIM